MGPEGGGSVREATQEMKPLGCGEEIQGSAKEGHLQKFEMETAKRSAL